METVVGIFRALGCRADLSGLPRWMVALLASGLLAACSASAPDLGETELPASGPGQVSAAKTANFANHGRTLPAGAASRRKLKIVKRLPPPPETRGGAIQLLSPGDELEVTFFGIEKLDRTVRIDSSGNISLPLIGTMKAAGKTARRLERDLALAYGRNYLQNPQISVNVKKSMGQRVTVNGAVRTPGIYPVSPGMNLLQAIALARGFTEIGDPSKVFVFRNINGQQFVAQYDVEAIRGGRQPNPRIYGGDIIVTFSSAAKVAMQNLQAILGLARTGASFALIP